MKISQVSPHRPCSLPSRIPIDLKLELWIHYETSSEKCEDPEPRAKLLIVYWWKIKNVTKSSQVSNFHIWALLRLKRMWRPKIFVSRASCTVCWGPKVSKRVPIFDPNDISEISFRDCEMGCGSGQNTSIFNVFISIPVTVLIYCRRVNHTLLEHSWNRRASIDPHYPIRTADNDTSYLYV